MTELKTPSTDNPVNRSTAILEVREGEGMIEKLPLEESRVIIGRSMEASVQLNSETVSRRHAELFRDPFGRWWLRDLGSSNGTRVGGQAITGAVLNPADGFEIGQYRLHLIDRESGLGEGELSGLGELGGPAFPTVAGPATMVQDDRLGTQIAMLHEVASPKIDTTHLSILSEFTNRLESIEDVGDRLRELCHLLVRREFHGLSAMGLRISRQDEKKDAETLCPPQFPENGRERPPYLSRGLLHTVLHTETPALASHAAEDPGAVALTMDSGAHDIATVACPLRISPETMDILYVTLPAEFGTGEWLTLAAYAAQTFTQAETARIARRQHEANAVIERDLARATKIQHGLVPQEPEIPGLSIAIGFEPCRWVGGDYVDVILLEDGRALLAVADVSGKGLPAAMVASGIHSMVHALHRAGTRLVDMIRVLNEHMCQFLSEGSFVTMVCMVIDPADGSYELVNSGHPPPAVFGPDGSIQLLQHSENFPLGIVPHEIQMERGKIEVGHMLAMFTDGLTEMTDENNAELGVERVTEHLRDILAGDGDAEGARSPEVDLDKVASQLTAILADYQGDRLPGDDRSFLLVGRF